MIYRLNTNYFVRSLEEKDAEGNYPKWFQDQEICKYNSHAKFNKNKAYFVEFINGLNSETSLVWAICHDQDGHVGNISLSDLNFINRTAELSIIIGEKKHWATGLGFLAAKKLIEHGFHKLNLEKIYLGTSENNIGMQKLAKKLGMHEEGRRRSHFYLEGNRYDSIEFGILKNEYNSLKNE